MLLPAPSIYTAGKTQDSKWGSRQHFLSTPNGKNYLDFQKKMCTPEHHIHILLMSVSFQNHWHRYAAITASFKLSTRFWNLAAGICSYSASRIRPVVLSGALFFVHYYSCAQRWHSNAKKNPTKSFPIFETRTKQRLPKLGKIRLLWHGTGLVDLWWQIQSRNVDLKGGRAWTGTLVGRGKKNTSWK